MKKYKVLTEKEMKRTIGGGSVFSKIGNTLGPAAYWLLKGLGNMSDVNQADRINRKKH
ncbi:bacteriocin-type signal sequence [Enterococcus faecalis ATCC 35038]|uniref:enterocin 1071A family bacteriocin n=1 Tax=Enterococcus faecalis TaxID=1351 RepID=UPI00033031E9|nr:enterocin 1071A family bacteriocin [Enterococcus faecalis]EGO7954076.1 lactococcin G-alpha/enterocin 1071A family bacteriocin [Enterococcus faecalis]EOJ52762.1 bacteriocin-type signal sequence [Enterococcus faecalis ATCC 35038]PLA94851.1 bacteriocin [Enterococcus faecalis]RXN39823.1 bacteriocin [Enterococcus faecalis]RXN52013.1 bacteriocin [Enterococcus faecalis]